MKAKRTNRMNEIALRIVRAITDLESLAVTESEEDETAWEGVRSR